MPLGVCVITHIESQCPGLRYEMGAPGRLGQWSLQLDLGVVSAGPTLGVNYSRTRMLRRVHVRIYV